MSLRYRLTGIIGLLLLCMAWAPDAEASHFRYGEIRCEPTSPGSLEYECYIKMAWRRSSGALGANVGDVRDVTFNSGDLQWGDGSTEAIVNLTTIAISTTDDWAVGEGTVTHTYPSAGAYTIQFGSCCRIGGLLNPGSSFQVKASLMAGNNAMPRTNIPPIVGYSQSQTAGTPALQQLPVFDPDGDATQCRLAPTTETGGGAHPTGFSVNSSCLMSWDNAGLTGGLYWTQIYVDQLDGQGNIVQTTPYDFILRLGGINTTPPTCDIAGTAPYHFHGGQTVDVFVGDALAFDLIAEDLDGDNVEVSITSSLGIGEQYEDAADNVITQPFGLQPEPFTVSVEKSAVTAADIGTHQFTATVTDANAATSQPCQLTVRVNPLPTTCPMVSISDFDSDQGANDTGEFVEISNPGNNAVNLNACYLGMWPALPLPEMSNYATQLRSTVAPGGSILIGNPGVANTAMTFPNNTMPDGPAGVAVVEGTSPATGFFVGNVNFADVRSSVVYVADGNIYGKYNSSASKGGDDNPLLRATEAVAALAQEADLPTEFALESNYPNPFNPSTTIRYRLAESVDVELAIFDALGREVRTLVTGSQDAGTHDVQWDGRDGAGQVLPSGVYVYRLKAGSFQQARTMLLMK